MASLYEIMDGVRRAKAAQLFGHSTIRAQVFKRDGSFLKELDVLISELRSPHKASISRVNSTEEARWLRVQNGAQQAPLPFPPIQVVPGKKGVKVEDIGFIFGGTP